MRATRRVPMQTYCFHYHFHGANWAFDLLAASPNEAEDRLRAIRETATYEGEFVGLVPLSPHWVDGVATWLNKKLWRLP